MPNATTYSLDQFAADMQELVKSQPDQATLFERGSVYLERFIRNPNAIPEEYQNEYVVDRVETTSVAWLGMSRAR